MYLVGHAGVVVEVADATGDLAASVLYGLARVECLQLGELVDPRLERPRQLVEKPCAILGFESPPRPTEGLTCGPHSVVDVLRHPSSHGGEHLLRRGVHDLEELSAPAGAPPAGDKELFVNLWHSGTSSARVCSVRTEHAHHLLFVAWRHPVDADHLVDDHVLVAV